MPSARAREPQARPRRVLISLYFVSLELTAALGLSFALGPTLSDVVNSGLYRPLTSHHYSVPPSRPQPYECSAKNASIVSGVSGV